MEISILGCGWLGLPLAQHLLQLEHKVKGSTTTPDKITLLESAGVEPFLIKLDPSMECTDCETFWRADVLVVNIPPGRRRDDVEEHHPRQIQSVIEHVRQHHIKRVIFISSTSVYPDGHGLVREKDAYEPSSGSGKALRKAEKLLMEQDDFDATILRFGGLYGYDRHPARYLAGRYDLDRGNAPVNMLHRDDAINVITRVIERNVSREIFNVCSDGHPPRREFYTTAAEHFDLEPPVFKEDKNDDYKIVSNQKLKETLNYTFYYPNPMDHTP